MSISIQLGNFLYRHFFPLYKPLYFRFKQSQDAFEIDLLKRFIKKGDVVLDIGANIGFYAKLLSDLSGPSGTVHCFEPDGGNFKHLQKETKGLSNLLINQNAVGATTGVLRFYTSPNLNVDHRSYEPEVYESVTEVNAVSVDDYLKPYGPKVDFVKMDIQGYEWQALAGMQQCLNNNPELVMISEFWPYGLKQSGSSLSSYFESLQNLGFHIYLMEKKQLQLLELQKVKALESLGEAHYFNILVTRRHVH
jgi:FkbM family methyltransferase